MAFDIWTAMYFPSSTLEKRKDTARLCLEVVVCRLVAARVLLFLLVAVARVRRRGMESYAA